MGKAEIKDGVLCLAKNASSYGETYAKLPDLTAYDFSEGITLTADILVWNYGSDWTSVFLLGDGEVGEDPGTYAYHFTQGFSSVTDWTGGDKVGYYGVDIRRPYTWDFFSYPDNRYKWYTVAVTITDSEMITYINGERVQRGIGDYSVIMDTFKVASHNCLGGSFFADPDFSGKMDNVGFMRRAIPQNNVTHDYEKVLGEFVSQLKSMLGNSLVLVYLTGSYARGDANDQSDLDIFCIFDHISRDVLETVGFCARNTSVEYDVLEINAQCMSVYEYKSRYFQEWSEYAVTELNGVLLYGEELFLAEDIKTVLAVSYKKSLADIIMSVRHYLCVDEPKEKITHRKICTYILKPLMFALRQERFCATGAYPFSVSDLLNSYSDDNRILVEYFMDKEQFDSDIEKDHKEVLIRMHDLIGRMLDA